MASSKIEGGYLRLPHKLNQVLQRFALSGPELRVILWVLDNSERWGRRDTPPVSVRVLAAKVCLPPATAGWVLRGHVLRGILLRMSHGGYRLNKHYGEWLARRPRQLALVANTKAQSAAPPDAPGRRPPRSKRAPFVPPTLADVQAYCAERKNKVDAAKFHTHYEANGWVTGKGAKPVVNWKALVIYWEKDAKSPATSGGKPCPLCEGPLPYPNAVVCHACRAYCRRCGEETAKLRIVTRADKTKTAVCAAGCSTEEPPQFMAGHHPRVPTKEKP